MSEKREIVRYASPRARLLATLVASALSVLALVSCSRPELNLGESCSLNTDCPSPLVCRLEVCRRQCVDSRDCGAGLRCLRFDGAASGGCQLPEESHCTLSSDCPVPLVCRFGTCTTACATDRDCLDGATCVAAMDGSAACDEPLSELCIYNSDCPEPYVCAPEQVCREQCREDRDCPNPRVCIDARCELLWTGP